MIIELYKEYFLLQKMQAGPHSTLDPTGSQSPFPAYSEIENI